MQESQYYTAVPSAFGAFHIVWRETSEGPRVRRLQLPDKRVPAEEFLRATCTSITSRSCAPIREMADQIQSYLKGEAVDFRLSLVDLGECSEFQKGVLLTQCGIPRGWVSTYGRIAMRLGVPGAARAVGTALARNPFPIIMPCHRTIRSNGDLGGFGGGVSMKRALLELEGVEFSAAGRAITTRFCY